MKRVIMATLLKNGKVYRMDSDQYQHWLKTGELPVSKRAKHPVDKPEDVEMICNSATESLDGCPK